MIRVLPAPACPPADLWAALRQRRSVREYADAPLTEEETSALLFAAAGRTDPEGRRTTPSMRDRRCVRAAWFDAQGAWLYDDERHALVLVSPGDHRGDVSHAQDFVQTAAAALVLWFDGDRAGELKGSEKKRFFDVDAGCMTQCALLAAQALGLGAVPRGWYENGPILKALHLDPERHRVLMTVTVGRRA